MSLMLPVSVGSKWHRFRSPQPTCMWVALLGSCVDAAIATFRIQDRLDRCRRQDLMVELDECIGEFMWGSMVFYRQWGVQARDLLLRPPEWCAA